MNQGPNPPSGSAGGRIGSLIHVSLFIVITRRWRAPTFVTAVIGQAFALFPRAGSAVGYFAEIESLRPSGAWNVSARAASTGSAAIGGRLYRTYLKGLNASSKAVFAYDATSW